MPERSRERRCRSRLGSWSFVDLSLEEGEVRLGELVSVEAVAENLDRSHDHDDLESDDDGRNRVDPHGRECSR